MLVFEFINIPAVVEFKRAVRRPAVVDKQIRIGMPRSLFESKENPNGLELPKSF
jgi:hypothetical protein